MGFRRDQSAEARIGTFLTGRGHDATGVARDDPAGLPDERVLAVADRERRLLIANKDFGEQVFRRGRPHSGVVLFRFPLDATAQEKIDALDRLLATHAGQLDRFLVVSPSEVRVR